MTEKTQAVGTVLFVIVLIVISGPVSAQVYEQTRSEQGSLQSLQDEGPRESFNVSSFWTFSAISPGENLTVSALIGNPNEFIDTQRIEVRFAGELVGHETVQIDSQDYTSLTFEIDTSNLTIGNESANDSVPPGDYIVGMYTQDEGEEAHVTLGEGFAVEDVSALDRSEGETSTTVQTTIRNPNDFRAVQEVTFRYEGVVVERTMVELDANELTILQLRFDPQSNQKTQNIGVFTAQTGKYATLEITEETNATEENNTTSL